MIIKNLTYKHPDAFKNVVNYVLQEADKDKPFLLTRYLKQKAPDAIIRQFQHNEQYRHIKRKNSVLLNMDILSFHAQSAPHLSDTVLKDLARHYIKLKCPNSIACVVIHRDKQSHHLHILYGIEYRTGKGVRISKDQFKDIKLSLEHYQREKYPQLVKSEIEHERNDKTRKPKINQKEFAMEHHRGKPSQKKQIIMDLEHAYTTAQSKADFFKKIQELGHQIYTKNGKTIGIKAKRKYRFKTLGYWEHTLLALDKSLTKDKRKALLKEIRQRQQAQEQKRTRDK